jgi:hypothetical protein
MASEEETALAALAGVHDSSTSTTHAVLTDLAGVMPGSTYSDNFGGSALVPVDSVDPIRVEGAFGSIGLELPFAESADDAQVLAPGVIAFANSNGSTVTALVKEDASVQIAIVIESPNSSSAYPFELEVPAGATVADNDGLITISGKDGSFIGAVAPAWALDAAGNAVATHFKLSGTTLTQVVDLTDEATVFPVVADPWLGANLFGLLQVNRNGRFKSQNVYSAVLSTWGTAVYYGAAQGGGIGAAAAGQVILRTAGWDELKTRLVGANPAATLQQQYDCHVTGGYAVWLAGLHWDLELARRSLPNWGPTIGSHGCNW